MKAVANALLACFFAVVSFVAYAEPLRFARIEDIPDQFVGGEILKAVYQRLNIPIELVDLPAKRALLDSSTGQLDGEVHRNINVSFQYPTLLRVEPAINYIEPSVFVQNLHVEVNGWDSIREYRIGIVRGVGTSEDGTRGMKNVLAVTTLDQLMQTLAAGRIDVAVSDAFSGLAVVRAAGLQDRISVLKPRLQRTDIYHYLHEKHRELVPRVERVLRDMEARGELESLRSRAMERYFARENGAGRAK
jgi:ABC-type amino acid transport substrate-binding protein